MTYVKEADAIRRDSHDDARPRRCNVPEWLRVKTGKGALTGATRELLHDCGVTTVCQEAMCPNIGECFGGGTATFMILGEVCTRDCRFCAVGHGQPSPPDPGEPARVADAAARLGLRCGAHRELVMTYRMSSSWPPWPPARAPARGYDRGIDLSFRGDIQASMVLAAGPCNHNLETVRRLQACGPRRITSARWRC